MAAKGAAGADFGAPERAAKGSGADGPGGAGEAGEVGEADDDDPPLGCTRAAKGSTGTDAAGVAAARPANGSGGTVLARGIGAKPSVACEGGRLVFDGARGPPKTGAWPAGAGAPKAPGWVLVRGASSVDDGGGAPCALGDVDGAANDGGCVAASPGGSVVAGTADAVSAADDATKTWLHLLQRMRTGPAPSFSSGTLKRVWQRSHAMITGASRCASADARRYQVRVLGPFLCSEWLSGMHMTRILVLSAA